ncbi:ganglioside-induced differentiation-associated protein 2-like [Punica granatum]|uniref:CRAL-TRIO domain-containing protein n=2 Tax=Punica granatum TaxID=22663 RepID=A0A218W164_PUNGR|nr:ganglioside-induced differentiation-associated protein 2-like [Punica granatum]OWM66485.1 hypothetical protein CDL15_Pgr013702 [Punica granatum]PKI59941.1 hypothetical protein CRG98_019714 [Punica granatum]
MNGAPPSPEEQEQLIEKSEVFKIRGHDKRGRKILRVVGKFFPGRSVTADAAIRYLEKRIYLRLSKRAFCVVYVHTGVQRADNFPGFSALRVIYESIPPYVKENLTVVHFVHPDLQSRLFFATFGRLLFGRELYEKLRYVSRLDQLWDQVRRTEIEIPEFVSDHDDDDLEYHPVIDYGLESDHPRAYTAPASVDSTVLSTFSMRCIS